MVIWKNKRIVPMADLAIWAALDDKMSGAANSVTDFSGNSRTLTTTANAAVIKADVLNGNSGVYFNSSNPLIYSGAVNLKHIFILASLENAAFSGFEGLLTGATGAPVLVGGSAGTTNFSNFLTGAGYQYRIAGVLKEETAQSAPVGGTTALIEVRVNAGFNFDAVQIGQDRADTTRRWKGYFYELLGYSALKDDYATDEIYQYFAQKFHVWQRSESGLNVFPFPSENNRAKEIGRKFFSSEAYGGSEKNLLRGSRFATADTPHSNRSQSEYEAALAFHAEHYAIKSFTFRDYKFYPPKDAAPFNFTTNLKDEGSGDTRLFNYSYGMKGAAEATGVFTVRLPPTVPNSVTAVKETATAVRVSWAASTPGDSPLAGYYLWRDSFVLDVGNVTAKVIGSLADGTHNFKVAAYDASGNSSAYSATAAITLTTVVADTPPAPTNPVTDDTADTFGFTLSAGYVLADHEYSLNSGTTFSPVTVNPISVGANNYSVGQILVRVKAAAGRKAGGSLSNTVAFTASASTLTNYALASNGGAASSAQSNNESLYPVASGINGVRAFSSGSEAWASQGVSGTTPAYYKVILSQARTISEFDMITIISFTQTTTVPTAETTVATAGYITAYEIEYLNSSGIWTNAGVTVTGNTKAWRRHTLATPITATEFRLKITGAADNIARLVEFEILGTPAAASAFAISETSPLPSGTVNTAYAKTIATTGGTLPHTAASIAAGALPAGLTANISAGAARISGTPTATGTFNFTVSITDSAGAAVTKAFALTIAATATNEPVSTVETRIVTTTNGKIIIKENGKLITF